MAASTFPFTHEMVVVHKLFRREFTQGARDAFAEALEEISVPLLAHLDQEESDILPLAQQHVTEEEWGLRYQAFGKRAYIKEATAVRGVAPVGL